MDPVLRHKSRLICEDELPSWLLKNVEEVYNVHVYITTWSTYIVHVYVLYCNQA